MKNLLIYISPTKSFNNPFPGLVNDATALVKVQIENSLELGWKKEDILLFTNFPFTYGQVTATVLSDVEYFKQEPRSTKFSSIVRLFERGLIGSETYWCHDLDAFQLAPLKESSLKLGKCDMGMVDSLEHREDNKEGAIAWNTSSFFFKSSSGDIIERTFEIMCKENINEEASLMYLTRIDGSIKKRIKKINNTYDFKHNHLEVRYLYAQKPIKIVHFHPNQLVGNIKPTRALDIFMGDNGLHTRIISKRLVRIFRYHRIK